MNTLYFIITLIALGAIPGLYLLTLVLRKKETPKLVALIHGSFVITALILLIYYFFQHGTGPLQSLILFVLAALGGLTLIYRDLTGKSLPFWLAIGHGSIAITAFIFLLVCSR